MQADDTPLLRRRSLLAAAGCAPLAAWPADAAFDPAHRLWYDQPAGPWIEALPVGNGRLGAMAFGRVAQERLQLNVDTLSAGGPYQPENPAALQTLPRVRALLDEGRFEEAAALAESGLMATPMVQMPYGSAGDLLVDFEGTAEPVRYRRDLDLDGAVCSTRFDTAAGTHRRELLCSEPAQVIAWRLRAPQLAFSVGWRHPLEQVFFGAPVSDPATGAVALQGAPWDHRELLREAERPATVQLGADGADALLVQARNVGVAGIEGALRYAVRVQVRCNGRVQVQGDRLQVQGATEALLVIALATSYRGPEDVGGDPVADVRARCAAAAGQPWARLLAAHQRSHRALYRGFELSLGGRDARPTHRRIADAESAQRPELAALYVHYARYLLISSSRPGSEPANLQGRWNEGLYPPWGSKFTININTEMNYWPAGPARLSPCVEPLLRMVEQLAASGARAARRMYGARGWVAHHNTDLWRAAAPIDGVLWGLWPCGGAWLALTLWDCHEHDPTPERLRRLYPLLAGAALFFVDTLVEDPKGRGLVTSPSMSPENEHRKGIALCAGPAMDRQIVRDLFDRTLEAHAALGRAEDEFTATLRRLRARLAPDRIGAQGQLQEWLEDWDAQAPEPRHRHVSHLYAVYPSRQIHVRSTPALAQAARVTLDARGDQSTGWATAWRIALWARLGDGERAHRILRGLLGPVRTYPNGFDSHPPFQIDGNFGGAAAILEMLVQSGGGEIHLLPALPAAWPEGRVRGLRARGGFELDLQWARGRVRRLLLQGTPGAALALRHAGGVLQTTLDARGRRLLSARDFDVPLMPPETTR